MKVSKEVWSALIPLAAVFLVGVLPLLIRHPKNILATWNFYIALVAFILFLLTLYFFRDPEIKVIVDNFFILSPASGRILAVETSPDKTVVRIFMNVFDYHIQRAPCSGRIKETVYIRGKFGNASTPSAHTENERNEVLFETVKGNILVTQIAGAIARRIILWKKEGDSIKQGDKFGMIKFGSQVDCEFPAACEILVKAGDKVSCARTRLAKWQLK